MKKLIVFAIFGLIASTTVYAQKRNVSDAEDIMEQSNPKWDEGRQLLQAAMQIPETMNDPKTWFVAGKFEDTFFNKQIDEQQHGHAAASVDKINQAVIDAYTYYLKADSLDRLPNEKGKVKRRFRKDIEKRIGLNMPTLRNAGAQYYDQHNFAKALEAWNLYIALQSAPITLQSSQKELHPDVPSDVAKIEFYAGTAAEQLKDTKTAEALYIEALKNPSGLELDIYKRLANIYREEGDENKLQAIVNEGIQKFPNEMSFRGIMIDYYGSKGESAKALDMIDKAIQVDPKNTVLYVVKGQLLDKMNKSDDALAVIAQALKIDPNSFEANYEMARILNNKAIDLKVASQANELVKSALPYIEKAHQLKPDDQEAKRLLANFYYQLGMNDKYEQLMKK